MQPSGELVILIALGDDVGMMDAALLSLADTILFVQHPLYGVETVMQGSFVIGGVGEV